MPMNNRNVRHHALRCGNRRWRPGRFALLAAAFALLLLPLTAHGAAITPFYTQNQSPVALIFGLPAPDNAAVLGKGELGGILAVDVANNFAADFNNNENILLDGESYRINLALRYGIAKGIEGGIDIPYVGIGGGVFDISSRGGTAFSVSLRKDAQMPHATGSSIPTSTTARPGCGSTTPVPAWEISASPRGCSSMMTSGLTPAR